MTITPKEAIEAADRNARMADALRQERDLLRKEVMRLQQRDIERMQAEANRG